MKFYARQRRMPQVIIVSLIDIFAILLIFVIVTTTFKKADQPSVTIKLPESKTASAADHPETPVVLTISESEEIFLDDRPVTLERYIEVLEHCLKRKAQRNFLPHQPGDLLDTWADVEAIKREVGYQPRTRLEFR